MIIFVFYRIHRKIDYNVDYLILNTKRQHRESELNSVLENTYFINIPQYRCFHYTRNYIIIITINRFVYFQFYTIDRL